MVRRRQASPKPSAPVRRSAPAPPPMAARPSPTPMSAPPPMSAPTQGPGLMAQMAATAGGVAIGSAVGHTVGHMITGGGSRNEVAEAPVPVSSAPAASQYSNACEFEWKQFLDCSQTQSDVSLCQGFNEAFKQCRARFA